MKIYSQIRDKGMRTFVLSLFVFLSAVVYGQKTKVKSVDVNPQDFTMTPLYMLPRRFPMKALVREFYVSVHNDSLDCYLPYMGEVYQPTLTNDGLNFKLPIIGQAMKEKKKSKHFYYRVRRNFLTYDYHFIFYPEGKATLILTPSNAQNCTYEGEWENH